MNHSSISAREDSRAEDRISVRGKSEPSGGGKGEQPYADRNIINLVNNLSRLEEAAVCLSMNHSSLSAREDSPGGEHNLGQRRERTLGRRGRVSGGGKSEPRNIHQLYRKSRAEITSLAKGYLVQKEKASSRMLNETSSISLIIHLST